MFIVIEGTDASGKTSLVSEIKKQLAVKYPRNEVEFFHKSKPEEMTRRWVLQDYVTSIENIDWSKRIALADRWHWGEVTYAPLKRPESGTGDGYGLLGVAGWRWTELFLQSRGVAQFWLYQPLDVITRRLNARGDDYVLASELGQILDLYENAALSCADLSARITPDADSLNELPILAGQIIAKAEQVQNDAKYLTQFPEYIGPRRPRVLLVGDKRNITKKHGEETMLPFMPVDGNSGEYLLTALQDPDWKQMGIVNANDTNSHEFDELWYTLGRPAIVVLGRLAERVIRAYGIPEERYVVVSHPQHVRRFFNSRKEEYGQAISRLAETKDKEDQWILR
jgi:hypothetical protein